MKDGDILFLASDGAWASFKPADLDDYVDPEHPSLGLDSLLQTLENRNKAPSDNLSIVILFWGVKQLESPNFDEFHEPNSIQLLDESIAAANPKPEEKADAEAEPVKKFDMKDLDNAIYEIESFISELDEKL